MVNEGILNYLKEGVKRGFGADRLKAELLKGKFNAGDVDEAITALKAPKEAPLEIPEKKQEVSPELKALIFGKAGAAEKETALPKVGGTKWMKIAGIIGIILFVLGLIGVGYQIYGMYFKVQPAQTAEFNANYGEAQTVAEAPMWLTALMIAMAVAAVVMLALFYFGFYKMGKQMQSKALKFSAISMMISPVLFAILGYISSRAVKGTVDWQAGGTLIGEQSVITNIDTLRTTLLLLTAAWAILIVFFIVISIIFSIGLIKSRNQIKFTNFSGIVNLILNVAETAEVVILGMIIIPIVTAANPVEAYIETFVMSLLQAAFGGGPLPLAVTLLAYIGYIGIAVTALWLILTLFLSLALFDASKKFE